MARYLWGISQLINDPSAQLAHVFHREVFISDEVEDCYTTCESENLPQSKKKSSNDTKKPQTKNGLCCNNNIDRPRPEHLSETIQVGSSFKKLRHVSIQCNRNLNKKTSRATSARQVAQLDTSTLTPHDTHIGDKNEETNTPIAIVCHDHRKVLRVLKHWSTDDDIKNIKTPTVYDRLKNRLQQILELLSLEKIQNVPEYSVNEKVYNKIYKSISSDNLNFKKVKKRKNRKNEIHKSDNSQNQDSNPK
nr:uncharacterized protein LOC128683545 [Plodia interpunctella]